MALWPVFLQWKQHPSLMHLACSVGVSLDRVMLSTFMVLGSFWGQGKEVEGWGHPPQSAWICIFCAWKVLAFSIHSLIVVGMVDMERIIVAIC